MPIPFRTRRPLAVALLLGAGCLATQAAQTAPPHTTRKASAVSQIKCANDQASRTVCMIRLILDEVQQRKGGHRGGGITEIKALSSLQYVVGISAEEGVQRSTYDFAWDNGTIRLVSRTPD